MKNPRISFFLCLTGCLLAARTAETKAQTVEKPIEYVSIFAYTPNDKGLALAWSTDGTTWTPVAGGRTLVGSDYGQWGSQKQMHDPRLIPTRGNRWVCVWAVNDRANQFAVATSDNLVDWHPQDYPYVSTSNCLAPIIFDNPKGYYEVVFKSGNGKHYSVTSTDLYHFTDAEPVAANRYEPFSSTATIDGKTYKGGITERVPREDVTYIEQRIQQADARNAQINELAKDDATRFAGLQPLVATVNVDAANAKKISDKLVGIFFEDINYSADGGLYAELVQNHDFEYAPTDRGNDKNWNATTAWTATGNATMEVSTTKPIHANNSHYIIMKTTGAGGVLQNEGFDGIALTAGETYQFSMFAKVPDGKKGKVNIRLVDENGSVLAEKSIDISGGEWKTYKAALKSTKTAPKAHLELIPAQAGKLAFDMVSLFPKNTFKNRPNGMRTDLAQTLADLHPKFMRFPGGCVAHGDGLANIYNWKETIGPLETRKPQRNIWGYHQSKGLGYYEFFQLCEDLDCEPLPVLAAGVCCQNSHTGGGGQQGGIPMDEMPAYVQDVLDLIEWANGDAKTTVWGRKRAEQGHPKPFNLKYIGIGNEDLISKTFEERYLMLCKAVKAKYPDIIVCGTVGPFFEGSDYTEGWRIAKENHIDMVDEHYYVAPAWYYYNQDFYDKYERNATKVYVGEYAAHVPGKRNCIESALAEAAHICNLERNGDVVAMSSYAPLLAKEGHTQWNPDMIYFTNTEVRPTVGYFAQKMCSQNCGDEYLASTLSVNETRTGVRERMAVSTVRDTKTGRTYIKMVNAMPYPVKTKLNLKGIVSTAKQADIEILSGNPDDRKARPRTDKMTVSPSCEYEMPAYSLTVIKL